MEHIDHERNPTLKEVVETDNKLKKILVEYTGAKLKPKDDEVDVEMIVEVMAAEFPEFLLAIAEENWIRGYEQALYDVDLGRDALKTSSKENDK